MMKIKNMNQDYKSAYQKFILDKKEKLSHGFIIGLISLVLAIIASLFSSAVLVCILSLISLILSGGESFAKFIKSAKKSKFNDTVFVLLAIVVSFLVGQFVLAATAMSVYKLLGVLMKFMTNRLGLMIKDAAEVVSEYANVVDDGMNVRRVYSKTLTQGTKIMVKNGETVPVDCVVIDGFSDFDTNNVYKSDVNLSASSGSKLLAGFVNIGTSVTCEAICDFDSSLVMDLNRLASMSDSKKTEGEKRFLTIAKWYQPIILILAAITLLIGGFVGGVWTSSIVRSCILLVISTTGAYTFAVPLISSCAVWNLKKKGLSLATADFIDEIADINCIAFEKNGILTNGEFEIKDIHTTEGISEDDFLMIAANCIGGRNNPISALLTKYMNQYIVAENMIEFPGKGIECTIMEKSFLCGSEAFMKECSVDVGELGGNTIYVSLDNVLIGAMLIQDSVKANTGDMLRNLRQVGVENIIMFSSERKETAELAYSDCGADEYYAELTPQGRTEIIQKLKEDEENVVAYIGEEINGDQAIVASDVGFTLINKNYNNLEYSKAILLGDLGTVTDAIELSRLTCGKIELHFYCASAIKIILAILGLFGAINIVSTVIIEALISIITIVSSIDLLKKK